MDDSHSQLRSARVPPDEEEDRNKLLGFGHSDDAMTLFNAYNLSPAVITVLRDARAAVGMTIPDLHQYLATLPGQQRVSIYHGLLNELDRFIEDTNELAESFVKPIFVKYDLIPKKEIQDKYPAAYNSMVLGIAQRDRRAEGWNKIIDLWGENMVKALDGIGAFKSSQTARAAARFAAAYPDWWKDARDRLVRAYLARRNKMILNARSNDEFLTTADFNNAREGVGSDITTPQRAGIVNNLGLYPHPVVGCLGLGDWEGAKQQTDRSLVLPMPQSTLKVQRREPPPLIDGTKPWKALDWQREAGSTTPTGSTPGRPSPQQGVSPTRQQREYDQRHGSQMQQAMYGTAAPGPSGTYGRSESLMSLTGSLSGGVGGIAPPRTTPGGGHIRTPSDKGIPSPKSAQHQRTVSRDSNASQRSSGSDGRGRSRTMSAGDKGEGIGSIAQDLGKMQLRNRRPRQSETEGTLPPIGTLGADSILSFGRPNDESTEVYMSHNFYTEVDQASGGGSTGEVTHVYGFDDPTEDEVIQSPQGPQRRKKKKNKTVTENVKATAEYDGSFASIDMDRRCRCHKEIDDDWKEEVQNAAGQYARKHAEEFLATYIHIIGRSLATGTGRMVCFRHTVRIAGFLGLLIKGNPHIQLVSKMRTIYMHTRTKDISALMGFDEVFAQVQTDRKYSHWFRRSQRPPVESDSLGPLRFFDEFSRRPPIYHITAEQQLDLYRKVVGKKNATMAEWENRGTINLPMFEWIVDGPLGQILDDEYEMYKWHQRMINDQPNYGWLRTMWHGIIQQLVRQYPLYWALYAALRPDRKVWFISYPYYSKYSQAGDSVEFRHIDLNAKLVAEFKLGTAQIQGSVSWNLESAKDCTILVPGMHTWLKDWVKVLVSRKQDKGGEVTKINRDNLTKEDLKRFKGQWETVPCDSGQVRISMPQLAHGAIGPAKNIRRTTLVWYCLIRPDHKRLEIEAGGTWQDLASAHRDLVPGPTSPSGKPNIHGNIPYRVPGSVVLRIPDAPISDALVGRIRWDSLEVQIDLKNMLDSSFEDVQAHMARWRAKATTAAKEAWELAKQAEKQAYSKTPRKSFVINVLERRAKNQRPNDRPAVDWSQDDTDDTHSYQYHGEQTESEVAVHLEEPMTKSDPSWGKYEDVTPGKLTNLLEGRQRQKKETIKE